MTNKIAMNFYILLFIITAISFGKPMIFTYHSKQSDKDRRFQYDYEVLKLALEKTKDKYGDYELQPLDKGINYRRVEYLAENNTFPNLVFKQSVTADLIHRLGYVSFPVDKGVVGYRTFFISEDIKDKLKKVKNLEQLRDYSVVQGAGWLDNAILRHHGFNVFDANSYEAMFRIVAANRSDLFPRGINEMYAEWEEHKDIENLAYDDSIMLYYPLPRFFFTNKGNTEAIERIQEGLLIANEDGSLDELWMRHYSESLDFVKFSDRKIFELSNPFLGNIDNSYEKYIYKLEDLKAMFEN